MTILDLIKKCSCQDVENKIKNYYNYKNSEMKKMRRLYLNLSNMLIKNVIDEEWYLCIAACRVEEDGTDYVVDVFDEDDTDLCYDVSAYHNGEKMLYSIASSSHEKFLQYIIDEDTLKKYTPETILAHALWELTCYGYEDKGGYDFGNMAN